jgi:hypothetical protein
MPQPFAGFLPSESSPHRNRAPLSGPHAPLRSSTDVLERSHSDLVTARFTDAHARAQLPGSPDDYELPFRALLGSPPQPRRPASTHRLTRFPVTLGPCRETAPFRQLHPLRSLDPPASPFAPTQVAPSLRPILSWVFAPLELSPSTPRILEPARTTRVRTCPDGRSLRDTTRGTSRPLAPGETPPTRKALGWSRRRGSDPSQGRPAPPLGGAPSSVVLGPPGEPFVP